MKITQLSVFLENEKGRLLAVIKALADAKVNIRALSMAETGDYGVIRMIVSDATAGEEALKKASLTVKRTDVLACEAQDKPGGLAAVLDKFSEAAINIEYMYAFVEKQGENAVMVFRVENADQASGKLESRGIKLLSGQDIEKL